MKYTIKPTTQFKKDLKKIQKQNKDLHLLTDILHLLAEGTPLPAKNRDHTLTGNYSGCRECHIQPDWLLIYYQTDTELYLYRTGTHADLFGL